MENSTKEILKGLEEKGISVTVENIHDILKKQGFVVKVHVGRIRNYFEISPEVFGVNIKEKSKDVKDFFENYINNGKMTFIPEKDEKELKNIEVNLRNAIRRMAIGYDNSFIPIEKYDDLMEKYEEVKERYFAKRDQILAYWDDTIDNFKKELYQTLLELNSINREDIYKKIISRIPTKEEYKNSFYINLSISTFPLIQNIEYIDKEDIREKIKQGYVSEVFETVNEITGDLLNTIFEGVNGLILALQKSPDVIPSRTLGKLRELPQIIERRNIFFNPKIDEIKGIIKGLIEEKDYDILSEKAENLLGLIYGYASDFNVAKYINLKNSIYTKHELLEIYKFLNS